MSRDMQKEQIIAELKKRGCRLTKQRERLLDIILSEDCGSCKELHYMAISQGISIGIATVYRLVNELENIGVLDRKKMYQVECGEVQSGNYVVEMDDGTMYCFSSRKMNDMLSVGLRACGYTQGKRVQEVKTKVPGNRLEGRRNPYHQKNKQA